MLKITSVLCVMGVFTAMFSVGCDDATDKRASYEGTIHGPGSGSVETQAALGVDEFMRSSDLPARPVTIEGVVSAVTEDSQMVALIDKQEAEKCGVLTCAILTLPVRWRGTMPQAGQVVLVRGQVENQTDGKVFVAESLALMESAPK